TREVRPEYERNSPRMSSNSYVNLKIATCLVRYADDRLIDQRFPMYRQAIEASPIARHFSTDIRRAARRTRRWLRASSRGMPIHSCPIWFETAFDAVSILTIPETRADRPSIGRADRNRNDRNPHHNKWRES
ncbi:hypothetical protein, partial [Burkholderia multivorans]|uniref:hypothetical protein n=1 Tax=Burkholderia multivorans TaxID=87883 RepID=UPI001C249975